MKTNPRPQGFSLVEVLIVMAILSIVMGALYATIFGSSSTFTSNTRMGSIQEDARRALDDLANEVRLADQKTLL
ncbi:MAG TPA: prepilin-type N-terminal cleavage/methylation domain-containing protein, partial [Planctomycetota bacterium]|nr:prepilin-type N-terminal cleavage/methylation domain-containing protein [Planctomycetota bacterium]